MNPPPPPPPSGRPPLPPRPPSSVAPMHQRYESRAGAEKRRNSGWRESGHGNEAVRSKQPAHSLPPLPVKKGNAPSSSSSSGRVETEEERRLRKKRELEKKQKLRESQNRILQKTQKLASGMKGDGSTSTPHTSHRRIAPLTENPLKKPTHFHGKLIFRNELPDPSAQLKILSLRKDPDRFTKYATTSLEKMHKPELYVEPDLGIPLDLLDLSVYNPPKGVKIPLAPEDEELLRDDDPITPIKKVGIKKKERPTDEGVSWLTKTEYISPLTSESAKQPLTEKQAKELRERRGGRNILEDLNDRNMQIQEIEASFEACKSRPVHPTNRELRPVKVQPLFPDFDRYKDQFVLANFDGAPTADSEDYNKLDKTLRDAYESQAIMKCFEATSSDADKPGKFLAYMVPAPNELSKDMYDENEDISYSKIREYHWDVRGDGADDPTTYAVAFGDTEAHYMPVPTKLVLKRKRGKEGKSNDEGEHFPVAARVTVRKNQHILPFKKKRLYKSFEGGVFSVHRNGLRAGFLVSIKPVLCFNSLFGQASPRPKGDFQFILDSIHTKFSGWKINFLKMTRRTILAKASLSSINNHITSHINKIQRSYVGILPTPNKKERCRRRGDWWWSGGMERSKGNRMPRWQLMQSCEVDLFKAVSSKVVRGISQRLPPFKALAVSELDLIILFVIPSLLSL
ncbi:Protein PAF1 -like protein [Capsicum annuum]|nr:Protein PAF1 -like protein [Capsicum annuum]